MSKRAGATKRKPAGHDDLIVRGQRRRLGDQVREGEVATKVAGGAAVADRDLDERRMLGQLIEAARSQELGVLTGQLIRRLPSCPRWAFPASGAELRCRDEAMTLEEQLRQEFADDTAYERLVLATIIDPIKPPPGAVFATNDIRGSGPRSFARGVHDSLGAGTVESVAARFRPLAFGAAYKILDFIVEMTMRLSGEPAPRGRWSFVEKTAFIRRGWPARLPAPLDSATPYWHRTAQLYAALEQHRHAVVHRRTRLEPNGDLTGVDPAGAALSPISVSEQDALSRYPTTLSDALIEGAASTRRLNALAWDLDLLNSHHRCGVLGATQPPGVIVNVIDDLLPGELGRWNLDGQRLHAYLREQNLRALDADAELHAVVDGRDVVYRAHLDDVPAATVEVDLAATPRWLRRV